MNCGRSGGPFSFGGNSCSWLFILLLISCICNNGGIFGGNNLASNNYGQCGCGAQRDLCD